MSLHSSKPDVSNIPFFKKVVIYNTSKRRIERIDSYSRSDILVGRTINTLFKSTDNGVVVVSSKIINLGSPDKYAELTTDSVDKFLPSRALFSPSYLKNVEATLLKK